MRCPFCDHAPTSVIRTEDGARRRHCPKCYRRWNTQEVMDSDVKLIERTKQMLAELGVAVSGQEEA